MGGPRWEPSDWKTYASTRSYDTKTTAEIFTSKHMDPSLDPKGVTVREACDSNLSPVSTALIVALDVTGSMGHLADVMVRKGLNTLCTEVYDRKPISDPHIMCMAIGDAEAGDQSPLQITQFETDIRIAQQLEKIWLEGRGGGNSYESYIMAWYFAAMHTSIDCFKKRNKKGYLFTIGDECATPYLRKEDIERVIGDKVQGSINAEDLLLQVSQMYEVFHIMVEEGDYFRHHPDRAKASWTKLLGQRAIPLSDHTKLAEVIVSVIQLNEGEAKDAVVSSWDGATSLVVNNATHAMVGGIPMATDGVVAL